MKESKPLKTIAEHNFYISNLGIETSKTGVACPKCGGELWYLGEEILLCDPPRRDVGCEKCNYLTSILC